jgi:murein DD-endopeptidase MepM/ murein hydrolase activator NlpD
MEKAPANGGAFVQTKKPELAKSEVIQLTSVVAKPAPKADALAKAASKPEEDRQSEQHVQQDRGATAFIKLADGFDFPVGKPNGKGYYKARGFRSHGHLGEDWDGLGGGDTDLGDPIYSIGDGVVVFARDCKMGWGNVIIVRHVFRDGGAIRNIDSLYGHLQKILVHRGQAVKRGQQIATLGNANGLYDAHLHLEIRKNIEIGMSRAAFARDFNNYCDPSQFIASHRVLPKSYGSFRVAMDTFRHDEKIRWDKVRRYSGHRGGSGSESAVALKKALASQGAGTQ